MFENVPITNQLKMALRVLEILETRAAGYTSLSIPPELIIEIEDKKKEIEDLRKRSTVATSTTDWFYQLLEIFDPELRTVFSQAYSIARNEGRSTIKTRYFFEAVNQLKPDELTEFLNCLPPDCFPKPRNIPILSEETLLRDETMLSGCIADSLSHLSQKISHDDNLSSLDVVIDLAKYGTGSSVRNLRQHGVTPELVEKYANQLELDIIRR